MKEILKLPIHIEDIDSVTDCWIYNRLAIIKTSPYYKDWIASHYNLYSDSSNFHFGEVNIYPPSYHEEILQRKSLRVFHMDSSNINVFKAKASIWASLISTVLYFGVQESLHIEII